MSKQDYLREEDRGMSEEAVEMQRKEGMCEEGVKVGGRVFWSGML